MVETPYTERSSLKISFPQFAGAVPTTEAIALIFVESALGEITPIEPILFVCCAVVLGVLGTRILGLITPTLKIDHVSGQSPT